MQNTLTITSQISVCTETVKTFQEQIFPWNKNIIIKSEEDVHFPLQYKFKNWKFKTYIRVVIDTLLIPFIKSFVFTSKYTYKD